MNIFQNDFNLKIAKVEKPFFLLFCQVLEEHLYPSSASASETFANLDAIDVWYCSKATVPADDRDPNESYYPALNLSQETKVSATSQEILVGFFFERSLSWRFLFLIL